MTRKPFVVGALLASALGLVVANGVPAFADIACSGTTTGQTFSQGMNVPAGHRCTLNGSTVQGNVMVGEGSALVAVNSRITGNISASGATVQLVRTSVGNNVASVRPTNFPDPTPTMPDRSLSKVFICGSTVGGSVTLIGAPSFGSIVLGGPRCDAAGGSNTVRGTLLDRDNRTSSHELVGNQFGSMVCSGNTPAPTGGANSAPVKTGQCSSL